MRAYKARLREWPRATFQRSLRCMRGTGPRATGKRSLKHARLQSAPTGVAPRYVSTQPPVHAGDRPPRYVLTSGFPDDSTSVDMHCRARACPSPGRNLRRNVYTKLKERSMQQRRMRNYGEKRQCTADVLERFAPIQNNETATLPSRARLNWTAPPLRPHRRPDVIGTTRGERGCV